MRGAAPACADGSALDAEGRVLETCISRGPARNARRLRTRPGARWDGSSRHESLRAKNVKNPCTGTKTRVAAFYSHICAIRAILQPQMSSIAALEKRVKALEDDEDFAKPSYVPPPPPAASSAGASSSEVDALRKENAKLQDLLAKERYRIKHLIRAIEAKS